MIRQSLLKRIEKIEAACIRQPTKIQQEKIQEMEQFLEADPQALSILEQIMRLKHDKGVDYISLLEQSNEARMLYQEYLHHHRKWLMNNEKKHFI